MTKPTKPTVPVAPKGQAVPDVKAVAHTLFAALNERADIIGKAELSVMQSLKKAAASLGKFAQGDETHKAFGLALQAEYVAKGSSDSSARSLASQYGKLILFYANGFEFQSLNSREALKEANEATVPFYTKSAAGRKSGTNETTKAGAVADLKRMVNATPSADVIALMSHAQQIEAFKALCVTLGVKLTPKQSEVVA